jgi:hypothetical protein
MMMDLDGLPLAVRRRSGLSWDLDLHGLGVLIPGQRNQNNNKRWFPAIRSIGGHSPSQRERGREVRQATVAVAAHEVSPVPLASCLAIIA